MEAKEEVYTETFVLFGKVVAIYLVVSQGFKLIRGIRNHILSGWFQTDLKRYGRWAVVTGASDGIGKSYARELAKRGHDVVLISRTLEKLKNVASEIEQKYGRKTKIMQADFTRGSEMYQSIEDGLKGMEIGILVNNVGMTVCDPFERFLDIPNINKAVTDTINCNILSVLQMTRIVLPQMVQRNKGLIINLSSEAGNRPYPLLNVYSATKAFVDFFSRGLHTEYQSKGITVQCVMPLYVSTAMTSHIKTDFFVKSAGDFAREALNTVGYTNRTSGCLAHSLQSYAIDLLLPKSVFSMKIVTDLIENAMTKNKNKDK
ncbi:very-long-chain 3-oxoacyl-CoA reductase-like [Pelobates fuscus]|uniref:very-long-chain 3-oxoacyl-CoA reductase-like n=1 Tax=Pelobates fuscus TaxID=191477 RepID=UPI002FE4AB52